MHFDLAGATDALTAAGAAERRFLQVSCKLNDARNCDVVTLM